jgi:hypothetical protein
MKKEGVAVLIFIVLLVIIIMAVFKTYSPEVTRNVHDNPDTYPVQSPVPSTISTVRDDSDSHNVSGIWVSYVRGTNIYSTHEEIITFFPNGSYHYEYYYGPMCSSSSDGNWSAVNNQTIIMDRSSEIRYDPLTDHLISGDKGFKGWYRGDYPDLPRCPPTTPREQDR